MKNFKFWKENKISQEYELTLGEIKAKYKAWLETEPKECAEYVGHSTVDMFIMVKEGLNSVCDLDVNQELKDELKNIRWNYINGKK